MIRLISLVVAGALLAGCAYTDQSTGKTYRSNTRTGVLLGALLGAAAGCATNTNSGEQCRKNAMIGAGVGAIAGAGVGRYMDQQQRALEEQLSNTGVGIRRDGDNIFLVMPSDITFAVDDSSLSPSFLPVLADVGAVFNEYPATLVDVYGHADSTGDEAYNQSLSERRADSVARYLIGQGVAGERFYAEGYGETRPIASNDTESGRAQNRRVEIVLRPHVQG